ncbi:uncharacterized protein LOC142558156 [Dermacentor variabilis]|uniref:uncharacterized protein LOC142558156 n=1 Tax=Dermacentor variabilis TaxID=34621 RepID=UPI003F5C05A1
MQMYRSAHLELVLTVTAVLYGYTAAGDCSTEGCGYLDILDTFKFFVLDATSDQQLDLRCLTVKKNGRTQKLITTDSTTEESYHASYKAKYMDNDGEPRDGEVSVTAQGKIYATWKSENVSESLQLGVRFHYADSCFVLEQLPQGNSGSKYHLFSSVSATDTDYEQCLEKLEEHTGGNVISKYDRLYCHPLVEKLEEETKLDYF